MAEYIEREAAIKEFSNNGSIFVYGKQQCKAIVSRLNDIPASDVAPVRHGKWVDDKGNLVPWDEKNKNCPSNSAFCSVCGDWLTASDEYPTIGKFCPNCGAKMDMEDGE